MSMDVPMDKPDDPDEPDEIELREMELEIEREYWEALHPEERCPPRE